MNSYYERSNLQHVPQLTKLAPGAASAYYNLENSIYLDSEVLPLKTKELIALAVAHVTGCPYCIDIHTGKYKELGGTMEEVMEAVLVAATTRAGAILSHATHAYVAFKKADDPKQEGNAPPECFC